MVYTFENGTLQEDIPCTISISLNITSQRFVVTDSTDSFKEYEVDIPTLIMENLKYTSEVVIAILGKHFSNSMKVDISETAMTCIEQICETNRLFF